MTPLSETIQIHVTKDCITITLSRFGQRYYVERVGALGTKLSDTPHADFSSAKEHFAELVEYHA